MKPFLVLLACCCALAAPLRAQQSWEQALRQMPLSMDTAINRDNCIALFLTAFQSNDVVKALVFLPAVSDDFYLLNRDRPKLNLRADNLLSAVAALTNATAVRATFKPPFLLLHLERDQIEPNVVAKHRPTAERLKGQCDVTHPVWTDMHWQRLQPIIHTAMNVEVLPAGPSRKAWHFARHNLAAWNLGDWEVLLALSLTGNTMVTVQKERLVFELRKTGKLVH